MTTQPFKLVSDKQPNGDQPQAIATLTKRILANQEKSHVLLGATGTGKTFTIANIIQNIQKPTLFLAHNKTLAGQLYTELKMLFPNNKVEYFISFYDYYQPEAYIPATDTFIAKESFNNDVIAMMRLAAIRSLATRKDVIVVASVACIYPLASPADFAQTKLLLKIADPTITRDQVIKTFVALRYEQNDLDLTAGKFRVRGDIVEFVSAYTDEYVVRLSFFDHQLESITLLDPLNKTVIKKEQEYLLTSANEYLTAHNKLLRAIERIKLELKQQGEYFASKKMLLEEQRLLQRTNYDLESLMEYGHCLGIENYAYHLQLREPGSTPYTLLDYFGDDWLLVVDESHITIPQVMGMHNGDRSRKEKLVQYGFRLPSAIENRPLNFTEFLQKIPQTIYVSATPNDWEIQVANHKVVQQIVRPTGLVDPKIEVHTSVGQIDDLMVQLQKQKAKNHRTLITVLTIRLAEELTTYLQQQKIKVAYLHHELNTLQRDKVLNDLRRGVYDVVVGINLLREGLDLPEVSLVCIFDANKSGFLRSDKSLIQIIGRAARNAEGRVIMYADHISPAMKVAIDETIRRRKIQLAHNEKYHIIPKTIIKSISADLEKINLATQLSQATKKKGRTTNLQKTITLLQQEMFKAAEAQEYELAAHIRDQIIELKTKIPTN